MSLTIQDRNGNFQFVKGTAGGNLLMSDKIIGASIGATEDLVFANSALINTQKVITITKPEEPCYEYAIVVHNPSAVTALIVKVFNVEAEGDAYITQVEIPAAKTETGTVINTYSFLLNGMFMGVNSKIVVSNKVVLGAAEGFTAKVKVREVR